MKTPTPPPGIVWLISRCRIAVEPQPPFGIASFEWSKVGRFRAATRDEAFTKAETATGAKRELLRVVGIESWVSAGKIS